MSARRDFDLAAQAYAATVRRVGPDDWSQLALGVWTVRDLVGHAGRALSTVETYLQPDPTSVPDLDGPVAYYRATRAQLADPEAVAERGRQAGRALGDDPAAAVGVLVERVTALVIASPDDAAVRTPVGTIRLADYLPTRTFELVVHTLDLARAADVPLPGWLPDPVTACAHLAIDLATAAGEVDGVLLALTGREPLRFSAV